MKYTQVAADAFDKIQLNAGILMTDFDPTTAAVTEANIIGATSGGVSFTATPTFLDFGEDIDNVPANTKELKKLDYWEAKMSGTFVTADTASAKLLCGAADISGNKITPRADILEADFTDIWWVGDYSEENGANGGFVAIKLINALSSGGFALQSSDKAKGTYAFEFTGHYTMTDMSKVPFEIYIQDGQSA